MSLSNCIDTVYKHDPDKFLALMAGDPISRQIAFPIYAFNCEVSRIPWITTESLIAEMRLTWWSELLEAVENNDSLPDHPISLELAKRLINNKFAIALLKQTITARRWDIYSEGHEDNSTLWEYIEHTSSNLLAACSTADQSIILFGRGIGMASYLLAAPKLKRLGKNPIPNFDEENVYTLAREALENINLVKRSKIERNIFPIMRIGWTAPVILRKIIKNPKALIDDRLDLSEFRKKIRLFRLTLLNNY